MIKNSMLFRLIFSIAVISFVFSSEVMGANPVKKVVFPKGKTLISYKGKLPREDYDAYLVHSRARQTLSINLITDDADAKLAVYESGGKLGPDEDTIVDFGGNTRQWSGKLPVTSEYSIQIYGAENGRSAGKSYTIEISLR